MSYNYVTTENLENGVLEDAGAVKLYCGVCGKPLNDGKDIEEFTEDNRIWDLYCGCRRAKSVLWQASYDTDFLQEYRLCDYVHSNYRSERQEKREEILNEYKADRIKYRSKNVFVSASGEIILTGVDSDSGSTKKLLKLRFDEETEKLLVDYYEEQMQKRAKPQSKTKPPSKLKPDTKKGGHRMNGFNFSMYQLDDPNIASTMLGVAVKTKSGPWRVYDKKKDEIVNLGDVQFGDFPLWVIPSLKLTPGDIIVDDDKYYCVISKNKRIQTVNIATGKAHSIVPEKNILGFSIYQKVVAITDALGFDTDILSGDSSGGDLFDDKSMILMAMMGGFGNSGATDEDDEDDEYDGRGSSNGMQGLLPLLLLGKEGGNFGDNNLLLLAAMSGGMGGINGQSDLMQLLLMKKLLIDGNPKTETEKA